MTLKQMTSIGYLSTYHQTDQNLSTFQIKITPFEEQGRTYPIYLSNQPDRSKPISTFYTNPFQMKKLLRNLALTLSTYPISQTDQNLSTHHHQPDYTNPFQMKKTPSEKQYSPYPIYLSHQPDRSEPINTSSSARLYQSIPDKKNSF